MRERTMDAGWKEGDKKINLQIPSIVGVVRALLNEHRSERILSVFHAKKNFWCRKQKLQVSRLMTSHPSSCSTRVMQRHAEAQRNEISLI